MRSYLDHLECTYCGSKFTDDEPFRTCPDCGKVLYPRYDLEGARKALPREALRGRRADMWRYFEVMPVRDEANVVSLGEGFTHIFPAERLGRELGVERLLIKDEGLNPTASFKARGLSAAVSKAKELGLTRLTMPSAGNAAEANMREVSITGAHLTLVDGLISDAGVLSRREAGEKDLFDVSTLQEPYRVEGKKTMGYEIAEQMGWTLPDAIVYPTGGGTGIVGMWKAFDEMEQMGWIDSKRPKMYCVQAEGCAPIVRAFDRGDEFAETWQNAETVAAGMRVPGAIGDYLILRALRESGGSAQTVSDEEILEWMRRVAGLEGIFVCPEGAATAAAVPKLLARGELSPQDTVLLLNTGSGLKNLELVSAS